MSFALRESSLSKSMGDRHFIILCVFASTVYAWHVSLIIAIDGIAASFTISVINYVLLGFQFHVDGFYMHNFEIWLACIVVFFGSGSVGYAIFEYRVGSKHLVGPLFVSNNLLDINLAQAASFLQNFVWIPVL